MKRLFLFLLSIALTGNLLAEEEMRTWTSSSGNTLEAAFVKSLGTMVLLKTKEGRTQRIRLTALSKEDQAYVRAKNSPIQPGAPKGGPVINPRGSKAGKYARQKFEPANGRITIGGIDFKGLYTEHFVILIDSGSPKEAAETAETVWEEIHKILPKLPESYAGSGMQTPLLFITDKYDYQKFGQWYVQELANRGDGGNAKKLSVLWNQLGSTNVTLGNSELGDLGTKNPKGFVFNETTNRKRGKMDPFRTHVISKGVLSRHTSPRTGLPFWLSNGFGYRMEIRLTDETMTHLIDYSQYQAYSNQEEGDVVRSQSFEDGKKWVSILRKLMRSSKGKKGDTGEVLGEMLSTLTPERCGYMFAFVDWIMHGENEEKFEQFVEKFRASGKSPTTADVLAAFGFETEDALQEAWHAWMLGREFR